MSYTTSFDGSIDITPPIPWGKIKDSPFLPVNAKGREGRDLMFTLTQYERHTDEGVLLVTQADSLVSTWSDEARGYSIVKHLQEVVDLFPDHEFTGRIDAQGEDAGDMWRLKVVERQATKFEPKIVWPRDSE